MEVFILANDIKVSVMAVENNYGQMVQCMKVTGAIIWQMELAGWYIVMEMSMRVNGWMIEQRVMELIIIVMAQNILVTGKMINSMEKEKRCGQMVQNMLEITLKERNKEREYFNGWILYFVIVFWSFFLLFFLL